ncbi:putative ricin-type beta-trefoil lectin domain protein [Streptomyces himastatinicus ATCC 53653]|uniref:Putative ricin-type beta-trefoil lectin domain protein n=1 Tax=Streptomyces himastatinicus ATCC 53653 TaxID=457427 RepID=D9WTU3_9ACTN|nr:putative ricin-type beta-trefoil lectin domain protein [Streptomyces himastatinicus ATCC 53653]
MVAGIVLALVLPLLSTATSQAASDKSLSVNLASTRGPSTGVGEGFLYGISEDGSRPADQFLRPLGINAFRGGGWFSGGWIRDGYQYGSATRADVDSIVAQAKRLTRPPYDAQYQVLVSDIYGANGGQPSNTRYPCDNGDCSNWVSFIDSTVGALRASGLTFSYDIWNEPDISAFWTRGVNSAQYFQMWDTAYREIRRIAPGAQIVGPSFAFTPERNPGQWRTWLAHVKAAGTVPDMIANHNEGDVDDPVTVARALNGALTAAGIGPLPLSSNEYQPADRQTAGVTAWYLARFAQSGYTNAMRGNWVCCVIPNLTGVLTQSGGSWQPTGNWWALRDYADMTGTLVDTSGQVGSTAISAAEDSSAKRAVAVIGDSNGYTGAASVTFDGLSSVPWLANAGGVHVTVHRIPDQAPLSAPQTVYDQNVSTSSGSITVPFTFQGSHDAFAVYLTPASSGGDGFPDGYHQFVVASDNLCMDVYGNSGSAGAAIDQWTCNGQGNQQFRFVPASGGYGELRAQNSGLDVAVADSSTAAGVPDIVQQAPGAAANSLWLPVRQSDGSYAFQNKNSGLCLDVYGAGDNPGQQLDQWPCKNTPGTNQDFILR